MRSPSWPSEWFTLSSNSCSYHFCKVDLSLVCLAIQGPHLGGFGNGIFCPHRCGKWLSQIFLNPLSHLRYLDYIHVMTYDPHSSWEGYTEENSPLYTYPTNTGSNAYLCGESLHTCSCRPEMRLCITWKFRDKTNENSANVSLDNYPV